MSDHEHDAVVHRILQTLDDKAALARQGIDLDWIERCGRLVHECQALRQRFRELEAQLGSAGMDPSHDTVVM